jgi:hypothetical protein
LGEIEDFIKEKFRLLDYVKILNYWETYFGKENIIIRDYDTCREDIIHSFLQCLDSDLSSEKNPVKDNSLQNKSLSAFGLAIMKELNKLGVDKSTAKKNYDLVDAIELLERKKQLTSLSFRMTSKERKALLDKFKESNVELRFNYGIDTNSWYIPESPYNDTDNPEYSKADLMELSAIILNQLNN